MAEPVNPGKSIYETGAAYRARMADAAVEAAAVTELAAAVVPVEIVPQKAVRKGKVVKVKPRTAKKAARKK
jgi:hypothetical protein